MHVTKNIAQLPNNPKLFSYLIALTLSTLLIGYAPSSIALGVLTFFACRYAIINKVKVRIETTGILLISLYILFCSSYLWSVDQPATLKGIGRTVSLLIVPIVFSLIPRISKNSYTFILSTFTKSNILLGLFFLSVAVIKYIQKQSFDVFTYHELVKILDLNAIYVSVYFTISYFFLLSKKNSSAFNKGGIFFLGIMILLLSSKMVIVVFLFCNLLYLLSYNKFNNKKNIKTVLIGLIAVLVFILFSPHFIERVKIENRANYEEVLNKKKFNRVYYWTGTTIRLLQLRILGDQVREDKILVKGFGLFASRENLKQRHTEFNTYHGYHKYNYHNMYAQILAELGIIGFLLLFFVLILSLRNALKFKLFLWIVFSILMLMLFLTESFLWVQRGIFLFTIMICLFDRSAFKSPL